MKRHKDADILIIPHAVELVWKLVVQLDVFSKIQNHFPQAGRPDIYPTQVPGGQDAHRERHSPPGSQAACPMVHDGPAQAVTVGLA